MTLQGGQGKFSVVYLLFVRIYTVEAFNIRITLKFSERSQSAGNFTGCPQQVSSNKTEREIHENPFRGFLARHIFVDFYKMVSQIPHSTFQYIDKLFSVTLSRRRRRERPGWMRSTPTGSSSPSLQTTRWRTPNIFKGLLVASYPPACSQQKFWYWSAAAIMMIMVSHNVDTGQP